jgi:hypothetical protein
MREKSLKRSSKVVVVAEKPGYREELLVDEEAHYLVV